MALLDLILAYLYSLISTSPWWSSSHREPWACLCKFDSSCFLMSLGSPFECPFPLLLLGYFLLPFKTRFEDFFFFWKCRIMGDLCRIYWQGHGCHWLLHAGGQVVDTRTGKLVTENPFCRDGRDVETECVWAKPLILWHLLHCSIKLHLQIINSKIKIIKDAMTANEEH